MADYPSEANPMRVEDHPAHSGFKASEHYAGYKEAASSAREKALEVKQILGSHYSLSGRDESSTTAAAVRGVYRSNVKKALENE